MTETEFRLTVNGTERSVTCEPDTLLLDVLRHDLGLAGPRFGCGDGAVRGVPRAHRGPRPRILRPAGVGPRRPGHHGGGAAG